MVATSTLIRAKVQQREFIERAATRNVASITRRMRQRALRALRLGLSTGPAIEQGFQEFIDLTSNELVRAHLESLLLEQVISEVQGLGRKGALTPRRISDIDRAIDFLTKRMNLDPADIAKLQASYTNHVISIVDPSKVKLSRNLQQAILEVQAEGLHVRSAIPKVRQAFQKSGINLGANQGFLLEQIIRTQTGLAIAAGEANARLDPALDAILWGYQYVAIDDSRVRANHLALDGTVAPKNDPIWQAITPPNGFNCRCVLVPIYVNELSRQKIDLPPDSVPFLIDGVEMNVVPEPDLGWDFHPGTLFAKIDSFAILQPA